MHFFEDYVAYIVLSIQEFLDIKAGGEPFNVVVTWTKHYQLKGVKFYINAVHISFNSVSGGQCFDLQGKKVIWEFEYAACRLCFCQPFLLNSQIIVIT